MSMALGDGSFRVFRLCSVTVGLVCFFFFFSSRRRHTRSKRDWSSDVCSSDVVFEDSRAAERPQDADREHRDGNRGGNGEPGAQADIHADRPKKQAKQRTEDHRADGEFPRALFRRDVGAKFSRRRGGTPGSLADGGLFAHQILLVRKSKLAATVSGDYALSPENRRGTRAA